MTIVTKEELKEKKGLNENLKTLAIILLVVAVGCLAVNQTLTFYYKAQFLKSPCSLCADLNKEKAKCINDCFTLSTSLYPDLKGNWKSQEGKCYDFKGNNISCLT